jgi:hypothetical protein
MQEAKARGTSTLSLQGRERQTQAPEPLLSLKPYAPNPVGDSHAYDDGERQLLDGHGVVEHLEEVKHVVHPTLQQCGSEGEVESGTSMALTVLKEKVSTVCTVSTVSTVIVESGSLGSIPPTSLRKPSKPMYRAVLQGDEGIAEGSVLRTSGSLQIPGIAVRMTGAKGNMKMKSHQKRNL